MPMIRVCTNLPDSSVPEGFENELTHVIAESFSKPPSRIGVEIAAGARLIHGDSKAPCTLITVKSVGALSATDNIRHTQKITELCMKKLNLPRDKVVIDYVDLDPNNVGFDGTTVADAIAKSKQ